jgi:divalent metal cation (Fe/Co/Zn/Cd) transporter
MLPRTEKLLAAGSFSSSVLALGADACPVQICPQTSCTQRPYIWRMTECCAPPPLILPPRSDRLALIREAFRLEWFTIGWMTVEAVVAIAAGVAAGSLVLLAFGLDSVIELASAGVLMWRLSVELRHGKAFSEAAERIASRIGGALLFLLAVYVTIAAVWHLWKGTGEEFSWPGFTVALAAIPAMRWLAHRKMVIAEKISSRALRADAIEAVTCGWLSFVVVATLAAQWLFGAWWIDGVGSLAIVWFLVKEGREAWSGEPCEACC